MHFRTSERKLGFSFCLRLRGWRDGGRLLRTVLACWKHDVTPICGVDVALVAIWPSVITGDWSGRFANCLRLFACLDAQNRPDAFLTSSGHVGGSRLFALAGMGKTRTFCDFETMTNTGARMMVALTGWPLKIVWCTLRPVTSRSLVDLWRRQRARVDSLHGCNFSTDGWNWERIAVMRSRWPSEGDRITSGSILRSRHFDVLRHGWGGRCHVFSSFYPNGRSSILFVLPWSVWP